MQQGLPTMTIQTIIAQHFADKRPGSSGVCKPESVLIQPSYLESFVRLLLVDLSVIC